MPFNLRFHRLVLEVFAWYYWMSFNNESHRKCHDSRFRQEVLDKQYSAAIFIWFHCNKKWIKVLIPLLNQRCKYS